METKDLSLETLDKIATVFSYVEDHVGSTLGPDGKNVLIQRNTDRGVEQFITKDGVTVIKNISFPPQMAEENAIVKIISDMSRRTDSVVGDGTTSTVVYANSLFQSLYRYKRLGLRTAPLLVGAKKATNEAVRILARYAHTVNKIEEIERIAYISSNGDKQISGILSTAFEEIGQSGSVVLNESNAPKPFKITVKNGLTLNSGLITRYFINNEHKKTCDIHSPLVLVTDYGITNLEPLLPVFDIAAKEERPLLIVCDFIDGNALQGVIKAMSRKDAVRVYVLTTSEYFGLKKKYLLEDVALFTGARLISKGTNDDVQDVKLADLGRVDRVEIAQKNSVIVGGAGSKEEIQKHVDFLKDQLGVTESEEEIAELNRRVLRFGSGVAEIFVGGSTEAEVREKRFRIDDALMAINSALLHGFVAGGGTTFIAMSGEMEKMLKKERGNMSDEEFFGYKAVLVSMHSILNRLLKNSEMDSNVSGIGARFSNLSEIGGERIREKILKSGKSGVGFNFRTKKFAKFIDDNNPANCVIEPALIIENVLSNALSIVTLLLNTERTLCRMEEKF